MKPKWTNLFAFLGKQKVESTADGVFMLESEIDKMEEVRLENESLQAALQSEKDLRIAAEQNLQSKVEEAVAVKQTEIDALVEEKNNFKSEIDSLKNDVSAKQTEIDSLKAGETTLEKKPDPALTQGNAAPKSKWDKIYAKSAAALRGDNSVVDEDEDEEFESPENRSKERD